MEGWALGEMGKMELVRTVEGGTATVTVGSMEGWAAVVQLEGVGVQKSREEVFSSGEGGLNHHDGPMAGLLWRQLPDTIAQSTTTTGINMLKQNVRDLQVRVNQLEKSINRACDVQDFCYIYLRPYGLSLNHVTKDSLSHILG